jgi:hypothetical protein
MWWVSGAFLGGETYDRFLRFIFRLAIANRRAVITRSCAGDHQTDAGRLDAILIRQHPRHHCLIEDTICRDGRGSMRLIHYDVGCGGS